VRKATILILAALALTAFAVSPIFACDHGAKTSASTGDAKAQMVGEHASCGAKADAASAKMMGEKGACTAHGDMKMSAAECAAKCAAMSPEDLAKCVKYDGQAQMINMSVKGMTCGGCENSVKASLEKIDGVVKVMSISYTDNTAMVVIDPTKTKPEVLTTAIVNKGYTAEVIPAVATTTTTMSEAHKSCTPEQKAACAAKKAAETQETSDKQPH
jgi:copper chaperone